jgi:hypothetical protein
MISILIEICQAYRQTSTPRAFLFRFLLAQSNELLKNDSFWTKKVFRVSGKLHSYTVSSVGNNTVPSQSDFVIGVVIICIKSKCTPQKNCFYVSSTHFC